jgi:signal transduction histidine kinase
VVQPESWPEVRGVPTWLEVIWWNLLMNALQHGNPGRIEIGWRKNGEDHQFWVADHGGGVPETRRSALFVPFDLLHEPDAGSGLGLSIVRRLVELQGGGCGYEQNRLGTRFFFTLPLASLAGQKDSQ